MLCFPGARENNNKNLVNYLDRFDLYNFMSFMTPETISMSSIFPTPNSLKSPITITIFP